jgi:hypothetical protein
MTVIIGIDPHKSTDSETCLNLQPPEVAPCGGAGVGPAVAPSDQSVCDPHTEWLVWVTTLALKA